MESVVRAKTHAYPRAEEDAMRAFYGGKRCIITLEAQHCEWSHQLDAALDSSAEPLARMLRFHLRVNRCPGHDAEVRENLVPYSPSVHRRRDSSVPSIVLFMEEPHLLRRLEYENNYMAYRRWFVERNRDDPGRPRYKDAFHDHETTNVHRLYYRSDQEIHRLAVPPTFYKEVQCPGNLGPTDFPAIPTLLSEPFSILYNLPKLIAMSGATPLRTRITKIALDIVHLWYGNPRDRLRHLPAGNIFTPEGATDPVPPQKPSPTDRTQPYTYYYPKSSITAPTDITIPATAASTHTYELASDAIIVCAVPTYEYSIDGQLLRSTSQSQPAAHDGEMEVAAGSAVFDWPSVSEVWASASSEDEEGPVEPEPDHVLLLEGIGRKNVEVADWRCEIPEYVLSEFEPLSATPFERGKLGGMSVLDRLMVQGLLEDPLVYVWGQRLDWPESLNRYPNSPRTD